jgi:hypothetical protein
MASAPTRGWSASAQPSRWPRPCVRPGPAASSAMSASRTGGPAGRGTVLLPTPGLHGGFAQVGHFPPELIDLVCGRQINLARCSTSCCWSSWPTVLPANPGPDRGIACSASWQSHATRLTPTQAATQPGAGPALVRAAPHPTRTTRTRRLSPAAAAHSGRPIRSRAAPVVCFSSPAGTGRTSGTYLILERVVGG